MEVKKNDFWPLETGFDVYLKIFANDWHVFEIWTADPACKVMAFIEHFNPDRAVISVIDILITEFFRL